MTDTGPLNRLTTLFTPDINSSSAARQGLQRLLLLRTLVTLCSVGGALVFAGLSHVQVPLILIAGLPAAIGVSLLLGLWRLKRARMITSGELCAHLSLDLVFLIMAIYYTGGASNPLISYLLVLLAVAATLLRQGQVNLFAAATIVIYTSFLVSELGGGSGGDGSDQQRITFELHLVGMWVTFVVSAVLITVFITRMAAGIRSRELTLAHARENEMRNEQLVAIGTLAAGTAHALGTPLSTMSVLLGELKREAGEPDTDRSALQEDIALLQQQVGRCRESINQLTRFYHKSGPDAGELTLDEFFDDIKDYIVNVHPRARTRFDLPEQSGQWQVASDITLRHAIVNIMENAIKAADNEVRVTLSIDAQKDRPVTITVRDDGPGIPEQVMEQLGEPFISTHRESMGLGIFLANAAVQRGGGAIEMYNLREGGAMTIVHLPARPVHGDAG